MAAGCGREGQPLARVNRANRTTAAVTEGPRRFGETAKVERRDITAHLVLSGKVVAPPGEYAAVASPYRATINRVFVTVGASVREGDALAQLAYPTAEAYYQDAREQVRLAEAALAQAKQQVSGNVAFAERQLAEARQAERDARTAYYGNTATRMPETYDVLAAQLNQARAVREAAQVALTNARRDRQAALAPYEQQVAAARAVFEQAQAGVKEAQIRSPIDGQVLSLDAQVGQVVGQEATAPVAVICDLSALRVHANVPPTQRRLVDADQPVRLHFAALPDQAFQGEVDQVMMRPSAGRQKEPAEPAWLATISFTNQDGLAKPDMPCEALVQVAQAKDVVAVPADAIETDDDGQHVVEVMRGESWQRVAVQTGISDGVYTEIVSGLTPGETVKMLAS
jgi:HlyD family secretion protein